MKLSVGFCKNVLGLTLKFETAEWSEFATEGATIALHKSEVKNSIEEDPKIVAAGKCRPGLSVSNLDDFHKQMIENNVKCLQEPKEVFGAGIAQFLDPESLAISVSGQRRDS